MLLIMDQCNSLNSRESQEKLHIKHPTVNGTMCVCIPPFNYIATVTAVYTPMMAPITAHIFIIKVKFKIFQSNGHERAA